jgi:hypothetical protein
MIGFQPYQKSCKTLESNLIMPTLSTKREKDKSRPSTTNYRQKGQLSNARRNIVQLTDLTFCVTSLDFTLFAKCLNLNVSEMESLLTQILSRWQTMQFSSDLRPVRTT